MMYSNKLTIKTFAPFSRRRILTSFPQFTFYMQGGGNSNWKYFKTMLKFYEVSHPNLPSRFYYTQKTCKFLPHRCWNWIFLECEKNLLIFLLFSLHPRYQYFPAFLTHISNNYKIRSCMFEYIRKSWRIYLRSRIAITCHIYVCR